MPAKKRAAAKQSADTGTMTMPLLKRNLLLDKPAPRYVTRVFHRKPVALFEGRVRTEDIQGWVDNVRISVLVKKFERDYSRRPTNKDLYTLLLDHDREFKIKELARSIFWNGVRVPIIVDADGRLLDGNRRYFATLHLLKTDPENRANYETINALVLPPDVDEETKNKVIIEMNFVEDPKLDWSPYVKARLVHKEFEMQRVPDPKELGDRFGWQASKIREAIETINLVNQFIAFHAQPTDQGEDGDGYRRLGSEMEAEILAAENYTLFWEARNKFRDKLEANIRFKEWFFDMMGRSPFKSIAQVRMLWECWQDEQSRSELERKTLEGVDRAILIVKAKEAGFNVGDAEDAGTVARREEMEKKIRKFSRWLLEQQIATLQTMGPETLQSLRDALETVLRVVEPSEDAE